MHNSGNGANIRNFIFVDDTVRAVETILIKGEVANVYNIGGCDERTVLEIAKLIICRLRPDMNEKWLDFLEFVPDRKFNDIRYSVNSNKLQALGWKQEMPFDEGFETTVKWYLDNPNHFHTA